MQAAICESFGSFSDVRIQTVLPPVLRPGTVKIAVMVAAANPPDVLMPEGRYQVKPELPFAIGLECSGIILDVADDVQGLRAGDRVMCYAGHGCFAEQVVVPAELVYPIPDAMSWEAAAGFSVTYGTAYHALVDRGQLQNGETVAVLGAAGGLGLCAVQIAKALGANVIALASTPEKRQICTEHGADAVLPSSTEGLKSQLQALTGGAGVDLIHDTVGGPLTMAALRGLRPHGRHLIVGYSSGEIPHIPANYILLKQVSIVGVSFRQCAQKTPEIAQAAMRKLISLWEEGKLHPPIAQIHPFDRFTDAVQALSSRSAIGKHLVRIAHQQ